MMRDVVGGDDDSDAKMIKATFMTIDEYDGDGESFLVSIASFGRQSVPSPTGNHKSAAKGFSEILSTCSRVTGNLSSRLHVAAT